MYMYIFIERERYISMFGLITIYIKISKLLLWVYIFGTRV